MINPPTKTPSDGCSWINIHAQIGPAIASVNAKIPTLADSVVLDPRVKQIKPGAY